MKQRAPISKRNRAIGLPMTMSTSADLSITSMSGRYIPIFHVIVSIQPIWSSSKIECSGVLLCYMHHCLRHVYSKRDERKSDSAGKRVAGTAVSLPDRAGRGGPWDFGWHQCIYRVLWSKSTAMAGIHHRSPIEWCNVTFTYNITLP